MPRIENASTIMARASTTRACAGVQGSLPPADYDHLEQVIQGSVAPSPLLKQVYLLGSDHGLWQGLRTIVRQMPGITVVGETRDPDAAIRVARNLAPDAVLLAADSARFPLLDLVGRLRLGCPGIALLIVGEQPDYELELGLARLGVGSVLVWQDVTPETVFACLYGVLVAGMCVMSPGVVAAIIAGSERRDRALRFTEPQRMVLRGLAAELTDAQIAEETGMGERTVERRIGELKGLFGVRTRAGVIDKAQLMGFAR